MIKTIGVIGVGGVGGYFGGKLCCARSGDAETQVCFLARGEHLAAIRRQGLSVSTSEEGDFVAEPAIAGDDVGDFPPLDLALICVKSFDLAEALATTAPCLRDDTLILPLLNGVDVYERIRAVEQRGHVLPACVFVGTHLAGPGRVVQRGGACRILFGDDPRRPSSKTGEVARLLDSAGIRHDCFDDVRPEIWKKYLFIAAFGLVTAAHAKTLGEVLASRELSRLVQDVMHEIVAVAGRLGVSLPATAVADAFAKASAFPPETKTSFQRDYEGGAGRDERELFGGAVLRLSVEAGLSAPVTQAIYESL